MNDERRNMRSTGKGLTGTEGDNLSNDRKIEYGLMKRNASSVSTEDAFLCTEGCNEINHLSAPITAPIKSPPKHSFLILSMAYVTLIMFRRIQSQMTQK